jgi:hypothetical protein
MLQRGFITIGFFWETGCKQINDLPSAQNNSYVEVACIEVIPFAVLK